MSAQEVKYVKSIFFFFFECYKIVENIHMIGSWFYICHQYSGCQLIKDFIKGQKTYITFSNFKIHLIFGS